MFRWPSASRALPDQEPDVRSFRVGVAASVSRGVTAGLLLPLMTMESCVPNVRTGEITELVRGLRGGDLDLVLTETSPPSALQTLRSGTSTASASWPWPRPERPAGAEVDWRRTPLIHYRAESAYRWEVDEWLDARGAKPPSPPRPTTAGSCSEAAARSAARARLPAALRHARRDPPRRVRPRHLRQRRHPPRPRPRPRADRAAGARDRAAPQQRRGDLRRPRVVVADSRLRPVPGAGTAPRPMLRKPVASARWTGRRAREHRASTRRDGRARAGAARPRRSESDERCIW